ncbi:MAG: HEXXH motif-containing putative peptide modification protein [Albidovulum sp.]|nr:HEXXH motif-containing putative peptide modification protein [Albidovulum sp.]
MNRDELVSLAEPVSWNTKTLSKLVAFSETEILKPIGMAFGSYGSVRMMQRNREAQRNWVWRMPIVPGLGFGIEALPESMSYLVTDNGTSLAKIGNLDGDHVCSVLRASCQLIYELSPELYNSVGSLLRCLHILENLEPGYDLSLSLPELPHSIFTSVPFVHEKDAIPRLAESVVHEVLHLQLSLIERISPVVRPSADTEFVYAPWRDENRPIGGVIHGLFVFRGIEILWSRSSRILPNEVYDFAQKRVDEIRNQRKLIEARNFSSLTRFGQDLFLRLIADSDECEIESDTA